MANQKNIRQEARRLVHQIEVLDRQALAQQRATGIDRLLLRYLVLTRPRRNPETPES